MGEGIKVSEGNGTVGGLIHSDTFTCLRLDWPCGVLARQSPREKRLRTLLVPQFFSVPPCLRVSVVNSDRAACREYHHPANAPSR